MLLLRFLRFYPCPILGDLLDDLVQLTVRLDKALATVHGTAIESAYHCNDLYPLYRQIRAIDDLLPDDDTSEDIHLAILLDDLKRRGLARSRLCREDGCTEWTLLLMDLLPCCMDHLPLNMKHLNYQLPRYFDGSNVDYSLSLTRGKTRVITNTSYIVRLNRQRDLPYQWLITFLDIVVSYLESHIELQDFMDLDLRYKTALFSLDAFGLDSRDVVNLILGYIDSAVYVCDSDSSDDDEK